MTAKRTAVSQFFEALQNRNFSTAEAILSEFRKKAKGEEWDHGYACAMEGLLLSARSNDDRYLYYKRVPSDPGLLQETRRKCKRRLAEMVFQDTSFDKGFFACWLDFLKSVENRAAPLSTTPTPRARQLPA
ncbi:MAG: hypothetical protein QW057_03070 [Candidatus Bathyarchaeia archaeon]